MQIEWFVIRLQVWAVCGVPVAYIQKTCKLQMPRIEKQGVVNGTTSLFTAPPPFLMCEPPFHLNAQCVSDNESERVIFKMKWLLSPFISLLCLIKETIGACVFSV